MGVQFDVTRVACPTSTGTQDITITDFGTPKGAIFIVSYAVTDGSAASHAVLCIGATDGTNHAVIHGYSEDGVGGSATGRRGTTDEVVQLGNSSTVDGEANFDQWITDGVRINWADNAPGSAYLLTVIFMNGTDLDVEVGNTLFTGAGADTTISGLSFRPDIVFGFGHGTSLGDSHSTAPSFTWGWAIDDGSETQRCCSLGIQSGVANSTCSIYQANNLWAINSFPSASDYSRAVSVSAFTNDGFTGTHVPGAVSTALAVAWMCIGLSDAVSLSVGTLDSPTSTGNEAYSAPGFTPQFVFLGSNYVPAENTKYDTGEVQTGVMALGAFSATSDYSTSIADEDGAADMNTQSLADDVALNVSESDGTAGLIAAFVSMDANGFTLDFTTTDTGTVRKIPYLAIEEEADTDLSIAIVESDMDYWVPGVKIT